MTYYNTTNSTGEELAKYKAKAASQEEMIMYAFGCFGSASPSEVNTKVFANRIPITSVRRALTNLTNEGRLVKTGTQVSGPYGRPEFVWKLAMKGQGDLF